MRFGAHASRSRPRYLGRVSRVANVISRWGLVRRLHMGQYLLRAADPIRRIGERAILSESKEYERTNPNVPFRKYSGARSKSRVALHRRSFYSRFRVEVLFPGGRCLLLDMRLVPTLPFLKAQRRRLLRVLVAGGRCLSSVAACVRK